MTETELLKTLAPANVPEHSLFHYTSLSGFQGIVVDKNIWATDISYLNDTREYTCAIDSILRRVKERTAVQPRLARLQSLIEGYKWDKRSLKPFVVSFSKHEDSLSQWRGYCGDESGVSLGFDPLFLVKTANDFADAHSNDDTAVFGTLTRCLYEEQEQNLKIDALINFFLEIPEEVDNREISHHAIVVGVMLLAPTFKDSSFSDEAEWRVIIQPINTKHIKLDYRKGKSMLVPYLKLPLSLEGDGLEKVVIGPTPHYELSIDSATAFLTSQLGHFPASQVVKSDVPYRHW